VWEWVGQWPGRVRTPMSMSSTSTDHNRGSGTVYPLGIPIVSSGIIDGEASFRGCGTVIGVGALASSSLR
jgi:hypothetical protein